MNDFSVFKSPPNDEFCPICQVPANSLKILFSVHVGMCDIRWNELEECINGVNCKNESVFHYRDFSHQILAAHRENLRKRKHEEAERCQEGSCEVKTEKENRRFKKVQRRKSTTVVYRVEADNEENIFVDKPKKLRKPNVTDDPRTEQPADQLSRSLCEETIASISIQDEDKCRVEREPNVLENVGSNDADDSCSTEMEFGEKFVTVHDSSLGNRSTTSLDSCSLRDEDDLNFDETCNINADKKEKCKTKWNQLFNNQQSAVEKEPRKKKSFFGSGPKEAKECPHFKIMPGTGFAVDAFQFGSLPGVTTYFLTHFHSDHYIGLKKSFSYPLYCSLITANLVKKKIRVPEKYLHVLELNKPIVLNRVEITCFDANHCPGAIMILFRLTNGEQYLHVGDFRASVSMEEEPELRGSHITRLYLDTTYFNPHYVFPSQKDVIDRVRKIVREKLEKHPEALFVAGTYLIGKEKVFLGILEELGGKLWAQAPKRDVFQCIGNETILSTLTTKSSEARIHVLPMNHLRFDRLQKHLFDQRGAYSHVFAFKPTGWEMGRKSGEDWINPTTNGNITIYGVPYSEHSNFKELCRFINFVKADKVIPTVTMGNRDMYRFLKKLVDSYRSPLKQQSIEQFLVK